MVQHNSCQYLYHISFFCTILWPTRTTCTYGPYIQAIFKARMHTAQVLKNAPTHMARTNGCQNAYGRMYGHVWAVCMGTFFDTPYVWALWYGCKKCTRTYRPYVRPVHTGRIPYVRVVRISFTVCAIAAIVYDTVLCTTLYNTTQYKVLYHPRLHVNRRHGLAVDCAMYYRRH